MAEDSLLKFSYLMPNSEGWEEREEGKKGEGSKGRMKGRKGEKEGRKEEWKR